MRMHRCLVWSILLTQVLAVSPRPVAAAFPGVNGPIVFAIGPEIAVVVEGGYRLLTRGNSDSEPSWSPDGKKIVFARATDGARDIFVMNGDGTNVTNLTNGTGVNSDPTWTPDGRISFARSTGGSRDIYVMDSDGTDVTNLTATPSDDVQPAWSPDGSRVVYASYQGGGGGYDLWVMNSDGSDRRRLHDDPVYARDPAWSPDGSRIAFTSLRDSTPPPGSVSNEEIYTIRSDGSDPVRLTFNALPLPDIGWAQLDEDPTWSPDGMQIAFISARNGFSQLWVMNADGTMQRALGSWTSHDRDPDWGIETDLTKERSIRFNLGRHLFASGNLYTVGEREQFAACVGGQPLLIQRRRHATWITVRTVTTSLDGRAAYRTQLRDRPGRYRVVAPETSALGYRCAAVRSRLVPHRHERLHGRVPR